MKKIKMALKSLKAVVGNIKMKRLMVRKRARKMKNGRNHRQRNVIGGTPVKSVTVVAVTKKRMAKNLRGGTNRAVVVKMTMLRTTTVRNVGTRVPAETVTMTEAKMTTRKRNAARKGADAIANDDETSIYEHANSKEWTPTELHSILHLLSKLVE